MFNSIITQNFLTFRSFSKTSWNLLYRIPAVGTIRTIYPVNSVSVSELVDCSTSDRLKLIWSGIVANSPGWVTGRYFASAVQGSSKLLLRHEDITYSTVNDFDTGCSESVATIGCDTAGSRRGQSQRSRSREALREPLWSQGQAVCLDSSGGSGGGGTWEYYTTTYVLTETDTKTITSTWSSLIPTATGSTSCRTDLGETACGNTCCGAAFVCANDQCIVGSSSIWVTATATPPVRGTTQSTMTQIATATTTQGFIPPVGTDGATLIGVHAGGGGLSGGAIAGIVIGVIAGVFILLLLCACMCCKGALDALFACLCPGRRKRKDTTYVEERYHHHAHGSKPEGRTWFGTRPSASEGGEKKSKWGSPSSYYYYSDYYTSASMSPLLLRLAVSS